MSAAASSGGLNAETIAGILVAAVAVAGYVGVRARGGLDRTRSKWRTQDQLEGWVDSQRRWHPGVIHLVLGWDDENGTHHPGLWDQVDDLKQDLDRHRTDPGVHGGDPR